MTTRERRHWRGRPILWCHYALTAFLAALPLIAAESAGKPIAIARPNRTDRVSFHREVLPVLQANCLPCHNQTRAKAGLILETPESMLKGGDSGAALVPGKPAEIGRASCRERV